MANPTFPITSRMISDYCRKRLAVVLSPLEVEAMRRYLTELLKQNILPLPLTTQTTWTNIALETGISVAHLESAHQQLAPIFDAVTRAVSRRGTSARPKNVPFTGGESASRKNTKQVLKTIDSIPKAGDLRSQRSKKINHDRSADECPKSLWTDWEEPATFKEALQLHINRHGDNALRLYRAVVSKEDTIDLRGFIRWTTGARVPRSIQSLKILNKIESRYGLPSGYFKAKLPHQARAARGHTLSEISPAERRRLAWHLPDDFSSRSIEEQEEILSWIKNVIIVGSTDYRAFQAAAMKTRYSVRFRAFQKGRRQNLKNRVCRDTNNERDTELTSKVVDAPAALEEEMLDLLQFKTSTLTAFGFQRNGVWNEETASQKVEHLGLLFGALIASPRTAVRGFGANPDDLCFAVLVFPAVWDWYLQWRERRRGFYTKWEVDMLSIILAMVRRDTGWLRQTPSLANRLKPIPGLVSESEIAAARSNWDDACDTMHKHGRGRTKEINRVARVHRDPFEPILPILEADSPVGEYRKITDEILRLIPDERRHPRAAAEMVRSFLMLRLGLHLGLRQRNLRELRVCLHGSLPTAERQLEDMKCGELRWSDKEGGWEVLIPSVGI